MLASPFPKKGKGIFLLSNLFSFLWQKKPDIFLIFVNSYNLNQDVITSSFVEEWPKSLFCWL